MLCGITCGSTAASLENNLINKVTPQMIEDEVISEHYFTAKDGRDGAVANGHYCGRESPTVDEGDLAPLNLVTFCVLILKNGMRVVGVNEGPVFSDNFDAEIGRKYARQKAVDQIWPMLGYELKTKLTGMGGI